MGAMRTEAKMRRAATEACGRDEKMGMASTEMIIELWRCDFGSFALLNVTMLICVFLDPVYGLIAGMVAALLRDAAETARADSRMIVGGSSVQAEASGDEHPSAVGHEA